MRIQLLVNLHHRESFSLVFAPLSRTYCLLHHPCPVGGIGGARLEMKCCCRAWTAAHLQNRSRGPPPCPPGVAEGTRPGPGGTCAAAGSTPMLLPQPWQRGAEQQHSLPRSPFSSVPQPGGFGSITSVIPLRAAALGAPLPPLCLANPPSSATSPWSQPHYASPRSASPPMALPSVGRWSQPWPPQHRAEVGGKPLAPLQMQLNFRSFFPSSFTTRARCWVTLWPAGRCPFRQGCCSPRWLPSLGSLGSRRRPQWGFLSHGARWPPAGQGLSWLRVWLLARQLLSLIATAKPEEHCSVPPAPAQRSKLHPWTPPEAFCRNKPSVKSRSFWPQLNFYMFTRTVSLHFRITRQSS